MSQRPTSRAGGLARLSLAVCAASLLALGAGGCSGSPDGSPEPRDTSARQAGSEEEASRQEANMPDEPPDLRATVVSVEPAESTGAASGAGTARVLVEGKGPRENTSGSRGRAANEAEGAPGKGQRYLLNLKVAPETRVLLRRGDTSISQASTKDIAAGQEVELWHTPETGRSYPAQAKAHTILIDRR